MLVWPKEASVLEVEKLVASGRGRKK